MQNKTMKRCLAALVAAVLVGVTVSLPATVEAYEYEEFRTNGGTIENNGTEYWNYATDVTNNGYVLINTGAITSNNLTVDDNFIEGTISTNDGTVNYNHGIVTENNGTVCDNGKRAGGTGLVVNNNNSGCVANNYI